ncbi:MAG: hypothetical protein ACI9DK_002503 [Vicingaceae bacterium]|jgi:hypothetical protein
MDILANPIEFETSTDGTVPKGAIVISFKNIGTTDGTVNNTTLKVGEATNYTFVGKPYDSIAYETKGSIFKIRYTI